MHETDRDVELARHPARVALHKPACDRGEREAFEQFVGPRAGLSGPHPLQAGGEHEVLAARCHEIAHLLLRHEPDGPAHALRMPGHLDAIHSRRAGVGLRERGEDLHGRRLAGAVGAKQCENRAALDREGDPVEGGDARLAPPARVGLAQFDRFESRSVHGHLPFGSAAKSMRVRVRKKTTRPPRMASHDQANPTAMLSATKAPSAMIQITTVYMPKRAAAAGS